MRSNMVFRIWRELARTVRDWAKVPGPPFAMVSILGLALGVIVGIADVVLGLAFPRVGVTDPGQLYSVAASSSVGFTSAMRDSVFARLRLADSSVGSLAFSKQTTERVEWDGMVRSLATERVSSGYIQTVGIQLERGAVPDGASGVVVLPGAQGWRRVERLHELGEIVRVNGEGLPILGVAMPGSTGPTPLQGTDLLVVTPDLSDPSAAFIRLSDGIPVGAAEQRLGELTEGLSGGARVNLRSVLAPTGGGGAETQAFLAGGGLLGSMAFTFLIAVSLNLASVVWTRWRRRTDEFRVRRAVGARPLELAGLALIELCVVLTFATIAGLLFGGVVRAVLLAWLPGPLPPVPGVRLGQLAGVVTCSLGFPILATALLGVRRVVKPSSRGRRGFDLVIVGQVAVSVALLGLGLYLGMAMVEVRGRDLGYETDGRFSVPIALATVDSDGSGFAGLQEKVLDIDGVLGIGLINSPIFPVDPSARVSLMSDDQPRASALTASVSPGFFGVVGADLLAGSDFPLQVSSGRTEVIVNDVFVRLMGSPQNLLGATILVDGEQAVVRAVVEGGTYGGESPLPMVFKRMGPTDRALAVLHVRVSSRDPAEILGDLAGLGVLRDRPHLAPLEEWFERSWLLTRAVGALCSVLAVGALMVTFLGIYASAANEIEGRRSQIAIREALGASAGRATRDELRGVTVSLVLGLGGGGFLTGVVMILWSGVGGGGVRPAVVSVCLAGAATLAAVAVGVAGPLASAWRRSTAHELRRI